MRVFALKKQSGRLFLAKRAGATAKASQHLPKAKAANPPLSAKIKPVIVRWRVYFFVFKYWEFEPVRVFALRKQSGRLFLAKRAGATAKASQQLPKANAAPLLSAKIKPVIARWRVYFLFVYIFFM